MRGSCFNCDRTNSEYRDEFGQYLCDSCFAFAVFEQEHDQHPPVTGGGARPSS